VANHLKLTLIFEAGREVGFCDQNDLIDGIIDLLTNQFPNHSGSCITCFTVDDNGDPIK